MLHVAMAAPGRIEEAARLLEASLGVPVHRSVEGAQLSAMTGSPRRALEALQALLAAGIEPADFSMGSPSLDEVFFALTGKERVAEEAQ
jgi:ABC-2 type transport system ATP-binding protein